MLVTIEADPKYPIGYKYEHYSTKKIVTVIGYRLAANIRDIGQERAPGAVYYITELDVAGQRVINHETAASTIARSKEVV